jgi:O-antigen ligase
MFKDYPMGVGYRGNLILSPQYIAPEFLSNSGLRAAHNTLMAILVDEGVPGAILFALLVLWVAYTLWRLKRLDRLGLTPWFGIYRAAVGASLAGLLISGQFLNLFSAEIQIWMIALLAGLNNLCCRSVLMDSTIPEPIKLAHNA